MSKDDTVQTSDLLRPRHVGKPIRRTEDPRLLTGNGEYHRRSQARSRASRCVFAAANNRMRRIVRIDMAKARAAPGVVAVFSADDVADDYKPIIPFSRMANYYATPIFALASKKVRYVGEAVVAVIAEDRYLAEDALELIDIEYAAARRSHRSRTGCFRGRTAPSRGSRDQCADRAGIQEGRRSCGSCSRAYSCP